MKSLRKRQLRLLLGVGAAIGMMVLLPTAVSASASINVVSTQLIARGAAVDTTITFTCTAGHVLHAPFDVDVGVQQAVSKREQATGTGFLVKRDDLHWSSADHCDPSSSRPIRPTI